MADAGEPARVNARILYWGIAGAGKSANLAFVRARLRPDHRGDLRRVPTRLDPTTTYEVLPIELGEVGGRRLNIEIATAPDGPEQAPTRKQLLDGVSGVVLVLDARRECVEANLASVEELRKSLAAYGQTLEDLPLVAQYNKRDLTDPYAVEELHRKLALPRAAVFEAVATEGRGVLQTLTTISKRVVRVLREPDAERPSAPPLPEPAAVAPARVQRAPSPAPAPAAVPAPAATPPTPTPRAGAPRAPIESTTRLDLPTYDPAERPSRELLEAALLAEAAEERAPARTQVVLEPPAAPVRAPAAAARPAAPPTPGAPGAGFEIVSVGEATRTGPRALRVPLTLANAAGERISFALTLQLEGLLDDPYE
jgi:hypothetical protein